jgi:hypothetical protein
MDEPYLVNDVLLEIATRSEHSWTNLLKVSKWFQLVIQDLLNKKKKEYLTDATLDNSIIKTSVSGNLLILQHLIQTHGLYNPVPVQIMVFVNAATIATKNNYIIYIKYLFKQAETFMRKRVPLIKYGVLQDAVYHTALASGNQELVELTISPDNEPWFNQYYNRWCKSLDLECASDGYVQRLINACESRCGACNYWNWGMRGAIMAHKMNPLKRMIEIYTDKAIFPSRKYRRIGVSIDWRQMYLTAAEFGNPEIFKFISEHCTKNYIVVDKVRARVLAKMSMNTDVLEMIC